MQFVSLISCLTSSICNKKQNQIHINKYQNKNSKSQRVAQLQPFYLQLKKSLLTYNHFKVSKLEIKSKYGSYIISYMRLFLPQFLHQAQLKLRVGQIFQFFTICFIYLFFRKLIQNATYNGKTEVIKNASVLFKSGPKKCRFTDLRSKGLSRPKKICWLETKRKMFPYPTWASNDYKTIKPDFTHSILILILRMLVKAGIEPKFYKYFKQTSFKYTEQQHKQIRQLLNTQTMKVQYLNPFITNILPKYTKQQLSPIILFIARQIDQVNIKNCNFSFLEAFVQNYFKDLVDILSTKEFLCEVFCLVLCKFLQECLINTQMGQTIQKIKKSRLIDLLLQIYQEIKDTNNSQNRPETKASTSALFLAVLGYGSVKYICQMSQQASNEERYITKAFKISILAIDLVHKDTQFEAVRDFVGFTTHLLIFNNSSVQPIKFYQFCIYKTQGLMEDKKKVQTINVDFEKKFLSSLEQYAKTDPQYLDSLLQLIKNLLELRIKSEAIIKTFSVLIQVVKSRLFPQLKIKIYKMLVENQDKRNSQIVDRLCEDMLEIDPDLLYKQTQSLNLKLATKGNNNRKEKFAQLYYKHSMKVNKRLHAITINFIFQVNLNLNLQLSNFQIFLGRQAILIESPALRKLHQAIYQHKNKSHLNYLEIILGKRLEKSLKNGKQLDLNCPFLEEEWLQAAKERFQVQQIYLEMIVTTVGSKSIMIDPQLINLSSCIIKIQNDYFPFGLKYYAMISKIATKYEIFSLIMFKYMLICQSIFGDKLEITSFKYFHICFFKVDDKNLNEIILLLQYLVRILKNKSSVLLYFQAILQLQRSQPQFYNKKLYDIQFLQILIEDSTFFCISTYSIEALTILQQLTIIIKDESFQKHANKIFKTWSRIMNRNECKNFNYLFCFRQIKNIFPYISEKEGKNNKERISQLWNLIIKLMDDDFEPIQLLKTNQNKILIEWTGQQTLKETKKGLLIQGDILKNRNMDINWNFFTLTTSIKTYNILLSNDRCIIQQRMSNQANKEVFKQTLVKQLKKSIEKIKISFKIQQIGISKIKAKATLIVADQQIQLPYEGYLQSILFEINSQAFIENLSIKNMVTNESLTHLSEHLNSLNRWQVKITSLSKIILNSFITKVDFQLVFYLLGEILKNFKQSNLSQGFKMFLKISCKLFKHLKKNEPKKQTPHEIQVMKKVFGLVRKAFANIKSNEQISFKIQLENPYQYFYYLYHLYVSALLPEELWRHFNKETKQYLIQLLHKCMNHEEFRLIQNSNFELFELLCALNYQFEEQQDITNEIILNHQQNKILRLKFGHYISLAKESPDFAERLSYLLKELVDSISSDNQEWIKKKTICKYLIIEADIIDIVFTFCKAQSKISLIHYIVHHPITLNSLKSDRVRQQKQEIQKIKELVGSMSKQERSQVIPLLIIEIKQDSLSKQLKRSLSNSIKKANLLNQNPNYLADILYINLFLLIKLWESITDDIFDDVITIIPSYLNKRATLLEFNEVIHLQTENTLCTQEYIEFLYKIKTEAKQQHQKYQKNFDQIFKLSFELICKSRKKKFLQFMKHYLEFAVKDLSFAFLPLQTDIFRKMEFYNHSVILQYIYQVLIKIKYTSCFQNQDQIDQFCKFAIGYLQFFTVNIEFASQMPKPLVYVYPKLVALKQPCIQKLVSKIKQTQKIPFLQLKGGLYFKLILIVLQLLESCNDVNFTSIIELLLIQKETTKKSMSSSRYNQPSSPNNLNRDKDQTPLERQLLGADEEHKRYYLFMQGGSNKDIPPVQYDLSYSLIQFFLMRLCEFLQNYSEILQESVLNSYSSLIIPYLKHPKIAREINEDNQYTPYEILKYQDILYLLNPQNQVSLKSPSAHQFTTLLSPKKTPNFGGGFGNFTANFVSSNFISEPTSPSKARKKSINITTIPKQRVQLYDELSKDPKRWSVVPRRINFAKLFGAKPKEIRFKEFLHIHNVLIRQGSKQLFFEVDKTNEIAAFVKNHKQQLKNQKSTTKDTSSNLDNHFPLRKIKKIYPYTSPSRTVLRIMQFAFSNMACPITELIQCKDYSLKRTNKESLNMINYSQDDEYQINSHQQSQKGSFKDYLNQVELLEEELKESAPHFRKGTQFCELITREGVYFCEWQLMDRQKKLKLKSLQTRPESDQFPNAIYGSPKDNLISKGEVEFIILFSEIQQIFYRKFAQIFNSIEIFMKNGTSKFILFYNKQILNVFIKLFQKVHKSLKVVRQPAKQFETLKYTQKWIEGNLSNFDYIMMLNKYSGRTHNDINQYYIFPWILKDYQSEKLDLSDFGIYRDLSKPIGAQNPDKLKRFKEIFKINMGTHFYGSHYSTSLFVLYYLVRLQPFSTLHRDIQKGNFDHADRLFSSIYQVWDTLMSESATSDIKELIPQFYYMPAFLRNVGKIDFGQKMCGQEVGDVDLPPWASSPEQFVLTMRAALQSDYVSQNLHLWIDLIFGKHQCSQEKYNVFINLTYQEKVQDIIKQLQSNPKQFQGHIHQIIYFGQCPTKLFNKQHKPKKPSHPNLLPARSSLKYKRPLSQTTSSQYNNQEVSIIKGWRFVQVQVENNKFHLQLQSTTNKRQSVEAVVDCFANFDALKESLVDLKAISSRRRQQSRIKYLQNKLKLDNSCLKIDEEIVVGLEMNFSFENIEVNEIWIVCFGLSGLRVYNWQQQVFWKWQKEQVSSVHLQATRMIFSSPSGRLCFYSFFDDRLQQIQGIKECSAMQVKVLPLPRSPSKMYKNQTQYKILCVGDNQKVALVDYVFQQTLNHTSLIFSGGH